MGIRICTRFCKGCTKRLLTGEDVPVTMQISEPKATVFNLRCYREVKAKVGKPCTFFVITNRCTVIPFTPKRFG
jgi:hypothetical protein